MRRSSTHATELERAGLLDQRNNSFWRVTDLGARLIADPVEIWAAICATELADDRRQLLEAVNGRSPIVAEDSTYSWLEEVDHNEVLDGLSGGQDVRLLMAVSQELEEMGLLGRRVSSGPTIRMHATYSGLVWGTRRDFTIESHFIDDLVAEWETTSVDNNKNAPLVLTVLGPVW